MQITATFESLEEMKSFAEKLAKGGTGEAVESAVKEAQVEEAAEQEPVQEGPQAFPQTEQKTEPVEESAYTLEEVRAKLAQLQKTGKRAEVKELLSSFGAVKLSEVPASKYAALMVKAGEI